MSPTTTEQDIDLLYALGTDPWERAEVGCRQGLRITRRENEQRA
ncbi:MAG: hypothetical protein ACP5JJ_10040 [Anaerolineae bacterium]